jgi:hypothetical protein
MQVPNTPQHAATRRNTPQHAATRRNTPQHAATRRNTPQHAATRRNTPLKTKLMVLLILSLNIASLFGQTPTQQQFPMEQFIGLNLRREDPIEYTKIAGIVREYHDWAIDEGNYLNDPTKFKEYPENRYNFKNSPATYTNFDDYYQKLKEKMGADGKICATMKQCLPRLAGGDTYGYYSEFKPIYTNLTNRTTNSFGVSILSPEERKFQENPLENGGLIIQPTGSSSSAASYKWYSDWLYQFARRYGPPNSNNDLASLKLMDANGADIAGTITDLNQNKVHYIEVWNEQNKFWIKGSDKADDNWRNITQFTGEEYAAMASAAFDAHNNNFTAQKGATTYYPGVNNANSAIKYVMGGTAGIREYDWFFITKMKKWFDDNRTGTFKYPFNVINFHHYNTGTWIDAQTAGVSPEADEWDLGDASLLNDANYYTARIGNIYDNAIKNRSEKNNTQAIQVGATMFKKRTFKQRLIELKKLVNDNFGSGVELWMSEFGWDTNKNSPESAKEKRDANNNIAIDAQGFALDRQEFQGMWITRGFMEIAAAQWDRAMLFDLRDEISSENAFRFNSSGMVKDKASGYAPKKSYYYLSTMRDALKGTIFNREITLAGDNTVLTSGQFANRSFNFTDDNFPRIYEFKKSTVTGTPNPNVAGEVVLAIWLPTSEGKTKSFTLNLATTFSTVVSASTPVTFVEMCQGDLDGKKTVIPITNNSLTFTISERPIFLKFAVSHPSVVLATPSVSAQGVSCDAVRATWTYSGDVSQLKCFRVYYYEKNDSEENPTISKAFNLGDDNLKFYSELSKDATSVFIAGLTKPHDNYYVFVQAVDNNDNISNPNVSTEGQGWKLVRTLDCENNIIRINTANISTNIPDNQTPSNPNPVSSLQQAINLFNDGSIEYCNPQRIDYGTMPYWENYNYGDNTVSCIEVDLGVAHNIDAISLLDGNGTDEIEIQYSTPTSSTTFLPLFNKNYSTINFRTWKYLPVDKIISSGIQKLKFIKKGQGAQLIKVILRGKPESNSSYETRCCGENQGAVAIGAAGTSTNFTQLSSIQQNAAVIQIDGNLNIDNSFYAYNKKFYMKPGSQITIKSNGYMDLYSTSIEGCETMWKGIDLEPKGQVWIYNSKLRDAEKALHIQRTNNWQGYTSFYMIESLFERNYQCLDIDYGQGITYDLHPYVAVYQSIFDGTKEDLKPAYPNQSNYGAKAFKGFHLRDVNMNIGYDWEGWYNNFQNFSWVGISSENSVTSINRAKFSNMHYGIDAWYTGFLTQKGFGGTDKSNPSFEGVAEAIKMYNTGFNISNNRMISPYYGLQNWAWDMPSTSIATHNRIENAGGIGLGVWSWGYIAATLSNNNISQVGSSRGIYAGGWGSGSLNLNISNNTIKTGDLSSNAIDLAYLNATVLNNTINFNNYNIAQSGIYLSSVSNSTFRDNTFTGVPDEGKYEYYKNATGIYSINSNNNAYRCNIFNRLKYGLVFNGENTTDPARERIAGNTFARNFNGIRLIDANTTIGTQIGRGNKWTHTIANGSNPAVFDINVDRAAKFEGNPNDNQKFFNQFTVKSGINIIDPRMNLPNNPANPLMVIEPTPVGLPNDWFIFKPDATTFDCTTGLVGQSGTGLNTRGVVENEVYNGVADDKFKGSNIPSGSMWILERSAYNDFYKNKDKSSKANVNKFLSKHSTAAIEQFRQLDQTLEDIGIADAPQKKRLLELGDLLTAKMAELNKAAFTFFNRPIEEVKKDLKNTKFAKDGFIDLADEYRAISKKMKTKSRQNIAELRRMNKKIVGEEPYVKYERIVNDIYLDVIESEKPKPTEAQAKTLLDIAMMCPQDAGNAPLKARAVYTLYDPSVLPAWKSCLSTRQAPPPSFLESNGLDFGVFPNPVQNELTIELSEYDEKAHYEWFLMDPTGQVVNAGLLKSNQTKVSIASFQNGVYLLNVQKDGKVNKTQKVIILK